LYAKHCNGKFILRVEDTDKERSTDANVHAIIEGMQWLGLDYDEGPFFQTERFNRYEEVLQQWLRDGKAYHCYCTKAELAELREHQMSTGEKTRYDGRCRDSQSPRNDVNPVVRFKNPRDGEVVVEDLVRGRVVFQNQELDDLIIARSDGTPTYNFTVVVDDSDMSISHVIRGDDHLNNTPRQMNMMEALDANVPKFAHLPMILGSDGAKLSKRHGAVDIRDYRDEGYIPEAILNYLVRLGWSKGDQEIFSIDEMIKFFDIVDVNQSASTFDVQKLNWLNRQYIMSASSEYLGECLAEAFDRIRFDYSNGPALIEVGDAYRERVETIQEMVESSRYCFEDFNEVDAASAKKHLRPVVLEPMRMARDELVKLDVWETASIDNVVQKVAEACDIKMGKIGQPIRVAVTGGAVSPPIDVTLCLVGKQRTIARLNHAIGLIESRIAASE